MPADVLGCMRGEYEAGVHGLLETLRGKGRWFPQNTVRRARQAVSSGFLIGNGESNAESARLPVWECKVPCCFLYFVQSKEPK